MDKRSDDMGKRWLPTPIFQSASSSWFHGAICAGEGLIYRAATETDCPELFAVLCWGGAAKRLKERDHYIGWDSVICANRLKIIVLLRRFYVIDSVRRPNLARQCLALSLRILRHAYGNTAFLQQGPEAFALQVAELHRLPCALQLECPGEEIFSLSWPFAGDATSSNESK